MKRALLLASILDERKQLLPAVHVELGVNVLDVGAHGVFRHLIDLCDIGRAPSFCQMGENFAFATSQVEFVRKSFDDCGLKGSLLRLRRRGNRGVGVSLSGGCVSNGRSEVALR